MQRIWLRCQKSCLLQIFITLCAGVTKLTLGLELDCMAFNWESVYYPPLLGAYCTSSKENCSHFVDSEIVWSGQHMGGRSATEKDCDRLTEVMATS